MQGPVFYAEPWQEEQVYIVIELLMREEGVRSPLTKYSIVRWGRSHLIDTELSSLWPHANIRNYTKNSTAILHWDHIYIYSIVLVYTDINMGTLRSIVRTHVSQRGEQNKWSYTNCDQTGTWNSGCTPTKPPRKFTNYSVPSWNFKTKHNPRHSMYGLFTCIYHKHQPNVGKYAIHWVFGNGTLRKDVAFFGFSLQFYTAWKMPRSCLFLSRSFFQLS